MKRRLVKSLSVAAVLLLAGIIFVCRVRPIPPSDVRSLPRPPRLEPDYAGVTIPPNIAPLNFRILETGTEFRVTLASTNGAYLYMPARDGVARFHPGSWRRFLKHTRGGSYTLTVVMKAPGGPWYRFSPVTNAVADDPIDSHLVYRLIPSIHHYWAHIEIRERSVESFRERCLLDNENIGRNHCINCHTFRANTPDLMSFHVRGPAWGPPMIMARPGSVEAVDMKTAARPQPAVYHSWHPSGNWVAFSRNKLSPFEHSAGETADVWDNDSDVFVYDRINQKVLSIPVLANPGRRETWPAWSADGRTIYFCSAPQLPFTQFQQVRYDLMRVACDPTGPTCGEAEMLVPADMSGLSAAHPRESPDGRWLLFSLTPYGNFPIYKDATDIYAMDLQTRTTRRLELNSDRCDSWHSWSSNSRWIAFSSKRGNGLLARVYFSHWGEDGTCTKPFVLPQENPDFYGSSVLTFNLPELVRGPVPHSPRTLAPVICNLESRIKPGEESPTGGTATATPLPVPGAPGTEWTPLP